MRALPLLLLTGLVALASWWLLGGRGLEQRKSDEARSEAQSDGEARAPAAGLEAGAAEPALQRDAAPSTETPTPFDPATADPAETFRVRVVQDTTGAPVPGAQVLYFDADEAGLERMRQSMRIHTDQERILEELGNIFVADDDGVAILPRPQSWMQIAARHEFSYGTVQGQGRSNLGPELEIRLSPVLHVMVHVEDETGVALAGLTVGYLIGDGLEARLPASATTDEHGDAELRHLETQIDSFSRGRRTRIVAMLPGIEPPGVDFSPDKPPRETVRIVVPRCGSARVEVFDVAGQPVRDGTPVTLQPALSPAQKAEWEQSAHGRPQIMPHPGLGAQNAFTQNGSARFPHVPLGLQLRCSASPDWSGYQAAVEAAGPQRPGEEVVIEVRQTQAHPLLTGRLVDGSGQPLGKVTLSGTFWSGWPDQPGTTVRMEFIELDAESRFHKVLESAVVPPGAGRILAIQRTLDADSRVQMAWILVPDQIPASGLDLGDVIFGSPLAVAGRVERADGRPVAGAPLRLHMALAPPEAMAEAGAGSVNYNLWQTDADGRFVLEGALPGINCQIRASDPEGGNSSYAPFSPGTADLRIVLEETGSITGRVLLDPNIPGDLLYVDYGPATFAADEQPWGSQTQVDRASGVFEMRGVKPGSWNLSLGLTTSHDPVTVIDGVIVPQGGGPASDPRLEIDLRGKLHLHRIVVTDADGGRPKRLNLFVLRDGDWQASGVPNPWDFLDPSPSLRGIVGAEGWGRVEVALPGGEVQVRLPRGLPIRLELEGDGLSLSDKGFKIMLRSSRDVAGPSHYLTHSLRAPWSWSTAVPTAGSYIVSVFVTRDDDNGAWYGDDPPVLIDGQREVTLPVASGAAEQVFKLPISASAVTQAKEQAKQD